MLKKFSVALIAASLLAAPAMAAGPVKDVTKNPVTTAAPNVKPVASIDGKLQAKPSVLNANAKMVRHHHRHARPLHHFHKKMGALGFHKHIASRTTSFKSTVAHIKRG